MTQSNIQNPLLGQGPTKTPKRSLYSKTCVVQLQTALRKVLEFIHELPVGVMIHDDNDSPSVTYVSSKIDHAKSYRMKEFQAIL